MDEHPAQPVFHSERFEQLLAFERLNVEMSGDEVGECAGVRDSLQDLLYDLGRQAGLLPQLGRALADFAMQRYERRIFLIEGREIRRLSDGRLEIAAGLGIVDCGTAGVAVEDQLNATEIALDLADPRDRAGGIEHPRGNLIDVLFLADCKDLAVGLLQGGFYGPQCRWTARANRRRNARKQHGIAQRQDGQSHPV